MGKSFDEGLGFIEGNQFNQPWIVTVPNFKRNTARSTKALLSNARSTPPGLCGFARWFLFLAKLARNYIILRSMLLRFECFESGRGNGLFFHSLRFFGRRVSRPFPPPFPFASSMRTGRELVFLYSLSDLPSLSEGSVSFWRSYVLDKDSEVYSICGTTEESHRKAGVILNPSFFSACSVKNLKKTRIGRPVSFWRSDVLHKEWNQMTFTERLKNLI
jgi:hypothetical protein